MKTQTAEAWCCAILIPSTHYHCKRQNTSQPGKWTSRSQSVTPWTSAWVYEKTAEFSLNFGEGTRVLSITSTIFSREKNLCIKLWLFYLISYIYWWCFLNWWIWFQGWKWLFQDIFKYRNFTACKKWHFGTYLF